MKDFLVVGVGNILREDDGIGIRIVNQLKEEIINEKIDFVDGGIKTFWLLDLIKTYKKIIIIDAINFNEEVGTIKIFQKEEIKEILNNNRYIINSHSFNLNEFFIFAEFEEFKGNIYLIGIQPYSINYKDEISEELKKRELEIKERIKKIIKKILAF